MTASAPASSSPGGPSRWRFAPRVLAAAVLGVLSAVLLAPELFGLARVQQFAALVSFRPALAVALLVCAGVVVLVRRRWWPVALAISAVAGVGLAVVVPRAFAGPTPDPGRSLTVLSLNVYEGHADVAVLAQTIHAHRPDVVVLPEAGERYRQLLAPQVADLGYRSWTTDPPGSPDVNGIVVLAAPWLGAMTASTLSLRTKFRWMELTGDQLGGVRLVAVHAAAPVPRRTQDWVTELGMLQAWCAPDRGSNIVIGDVNATLDHTDLRAGIEGCIDAAADRGEGLVATWPTYLPRWLGVQIDHVFTSGGVRPQSLEVLDIPGSDHRALLTRVVLPNA